MQWKKHLKEVPEGAHAFLGASKYSWINYSDEELVEAYRRDAAKKRGVELHELAALLIKNKQKLPKSNKTLNLYVNDSIGFGMVSEQPLYYSRNCFGTADAIGFRKRYLRIHDLKTGTSRASLHQLEIYAALFCLDYNIKPGELSGCELRIYQNDNVLVSNLEADGLLPIIDKIIRFDKKIEKLREQGYE